MNSKKIVYIGLIMLLTVSSCISTRYLTDPVSIDRQHDMRSHRTGGNLGDVGLNCGSLFMSLFLNSGFEVISRERAFKKISLVNESTDTLIVNMVTDIVWKETGYCDIMGIMLPPAAHQKLLVPYPAAYNVYFKTPYSEEENIEIRTDSNLRIIKLKSGMTKAPLQEEKDGSGPSLPARQESQ
ncbi:MAG TPA: hypothetical protein VF373_05025 [Prolixibacteraceae bacterium]